jgi:hypothetical protein
VSEVRVGDHNVGQSLDIAKAMRKPGYTQYFLLNYPYDSSTL